MAAYAATVRKPDGVIIEAGFPDARSAVRGSPPLAVLSLLASYRFPTADFINQANVPVLQLHGDRDSVIPIELGRELFGRSPDRRNSSSFRAAIITTSAAECGRLLGRDRQIHQER